MWLVAAIVIIVLAADQLLKFWVKTNMSLGEEIPMIGNWFKLHFTENDGMAFGIELPGTFGKLFLTLFRLVAVSGIIYYLLIQVRRGIDRSTVVLIALILAGALGNIIDSVFYGRWFNDLGMAEWSQGGNGYDKWFHGQVVDMFYFPLFSGTYPTWVPFKGGQSFTFFSAIFNIADAAISIGLFAILLFKRSLFNQLKEDVSSETSSENKETEKAVENPTP